MILLQVAASPRMGMGMGMYLVILIIIIIAVALYLNRQKKEQWMEERQRPDISQPGKNKVVNVTLMGGIIGMITCQPDKKLNSAIRAENANGWRTVQVIPSSSGNILLWLWRLLLLVCTLFLYTTANGYYVIMERE